MKKQTQTPTDFFYFITKGKFAICDLNFCDKSDCTIDIPFFEMANNEALLNKLQLYYMQGNYGVNYTYESRAKWFAGYLSAFCDTGSKEAQLEKEAQREKAYTNPTVRILIEDKALYAEIKKVI